MVVEEADQLAVHLAAPDNWRNKHSHGQSNLDLIAEPNHRESLARQSIEVPRERVMEEKDRNSPALRGQAYARQT
jgi:hypothetical protein